MPALATGANAANGDIIYIGVSGDGDSLSIGMGQLSHAIRRNVNLLYILENNGVYGLTKEVSSRPRPTRARPARRARPTPWRRSTERCWR